MQIKDSCSDSAHIQGERNLWLIPASIIKQLCHTEEVSSVAASTCRAFTLPATLQKWLQATAILGQLNSTVIYCVNAVFLVLPDLKIMSFRN